MGEGGFFNNLYCGTNRSVIGRIKSTIQTQCFNNFVADCRSAALGLTVAGYTKQKNLYHIVSFA